MMEVEGRANDKQIGWDGRQDMTLRLLRGNNNQLDYTAVSEIITPDPVALRQAPLEITSIAGEDLEMLLYHDLLPRTQNLAHEITDQYTNAYDKAVALETFLAGNNFEYTLSLPALPPEHAIDSFINDVRLGHCEFFASAMALMLRSVGVPTRVVSGYRGGEWSDGAGAYIVRQSMAHLWLEVFIEGSGWVRFDPAPPSNETPKAGWAGFIQRINDLQLRAKLFWYREVISFDRGAQIERLRSLPGGIMRAFGLDRFFDPGAPRAEGAGTNGLGAIAAVAVITLAIVGVAALLRRRKEPFPLTRDQRLAVRLFSELRNRLAKAGIDVIGLSAEELEREVSQRGWTEFGDIQQTLRLYNEVRFGAKPLDRPRLDMLLRRMRALRPPKPRKA